MFQICFEHRHIGGVSQRIPSAILFESLGRVCGKKSVVDAWHTGYIRFIQTEIRSIHTTIADVCIEELLIYSTKIALTFIFIVFHS